MLNKAEYLSGVNTIKIPNKLLAIIKYQALVLKQTKFSIAIRKSQDKLSKGFIRSVNNMPVCMPLSSAFIKQSNMYNKQWCVEFYIAYSYMKGALFALIYFFFMGASSFKVERKRFSKSSQFNFGNPEKPSLLDTLSLKASLSRDL